MSEKSDYTGRIRAKGLTGTGVTEAMLGRHHRNKGGRLMIVASIHVAGVSENLDEGTGDVAYVIDELEVAPDTAMDHVRNLVRSFNYERLLDANGPTLPLDDHGDMRGDEPTVEQVVAAGGRFEPHPFLPVLTGEDDEAPICDVCGLVEDTGPHDTSTDEPPVDDDTAYDDTAYDDADDHTATDELEGAHT